MVRRGCDRTLPELREALLDQGVEIPMFAHVPRAIALAVAAIGAEIEEDGRLDKALAGVFAGMTADDLGRRVDSTVLD